MKISLATSVGGSYTLGFNDGGAPPAPPGFMEISRLGGAGPWDGALRLEGVYVALTAPTREQLLEAARSLRPLRT